MLSGGQNMTRVVNCAFLGKQLEGLERVPYPGALGQRIYQQISKQAWDEWIARQTMIINENGLSTIDPSSLVIIEQHMTGFLFKEGEYGQLPEGFRTTSAK